MPFIGNKPSAVPLTSADIADGIITSAKITDATIANADIANSTINLTTKVTGTLPVANGGTGLSALGSANQVLAVNSGATALAYTSVSSDYVLLASTDASSSASVSFDGYYSSTYKNYILYISYATPSASSLPCLRYRRSNADVTASNYYASSIYGYNAAGGGSNGPLSYMDFTSWGFNNTTANGGINCVINIYNPLNTSAYKYINGTWSYSGTYGGYHVGGASSGYLTDSTAALSGITFLFSTGNIASGNFKLYGLK